MFSSELHTYISNQPPDIATWMYFRQKNAKQNSPISSSPHPPGLSELRSFLSSKWHHVLLRSENWKSSLTPPCLISHSHLLSKFHWFLSQNVSPACLPNLHSFQPNLRLHPLSLAVQQWSSNVHLSSFIPAPPIHLCSGHRGFYKT